MANISSELLEILRCPHCVSGATRQPGDDPGQLIVHQDVWLLCQTCARKYPIKDGIPIMLIEEGDKWAAARVEELPVPPPAN